MPEGGSGGGSGPGGHPGVVEVELTADPVATATNIEMVRDDGYKFSFWYSVGSQSFAVFEQGYKK